MSLCVSKSSKQNLVYGDLIEANLLTSLSHIYLLNSAQFWVLTLCLWVCQYLPSSLEMFLCDSGTSKMYLVHGALIEAEILTSPSPMYLPNLSWVLGTGTLPAVCHHLPSALEMFYVSKEPQKHLVHGALIEAEIWTSPSPCICSAWPGFWAPALCPQVCQYLPCDVEMFLHVSGTSEKYLVHGALLDAEILTSPLCHISAPLGLVFGH